MPRSACARAGSAGSTWRDWVPATRTGSLSIASTAPMRAPPGVPDGAPAAAATSARRMACPAGPAAPTTATSIALRRERTAPRGNSLWPPHGCLVQNHPRSPPENRRARPAQPARTARTRRGAGGHPSAAARDPGDAVRPHRRPGHRPRDGPDARGHGHRQDRPRHAPDGDGPGAGDVRLDRRRAVQRRRWPPTPPARRSPPPATRASRRAQSAQVDQAAQVAELWLDQVTSLAAPGISTHAWSRAEWVEATMPTWRSLVEPVAEGVGRAISGAMRAQIEQMGEGALPEGILPAGMDPKAAARRDGAPAGPDERLDVRRCRSARPSARSPRRPLSGTEVGLPLVGDQAVALLPANIAAFAEGLEVDLEPGAPLPRRPRGRPGAPLRRRAVARARSCWPRCGTTPATSPSTPSASSRPSSRSTRPTPRPSRQSLQDQLFRPEPSPAQQAALARLETYLALVEGWVDVVDRAGHPRAPAADGARSARPYAAAARRAGRPRRRSPGWSGSSCARAGCATPPTSSLPSRPGRRRGPRRRPGATPTSPRPRPTSTTRSGYVERAGRGPSGDDMDAALDQILREGEPAADPRSGR